MGSAADAAPEIDRLVLSVNRGIDWARLQSLAVATRLDDLDLIHHWWDFLLAGVLSTELALLRSRYVPEDRVRGRLAELESKGLIRSDATGWRATADGASFLEALGEAQAVRATWAWKGHEASVAIAADIADELAAAASDDHVVAVVHRSLTPPANRYHALHHRLVTLRYIRQHDHAEAWGEAGLIAADTVVMTALWHDNWVDASDPRLSHLVELGYANGETPTLTAMGRRLREAIEAETNHRADETFDILDEPTAARFLSALRALPGGH